MARRGTTRPRKTAPAARLRDGLRLVKGAAAENAGFARAGDLIVGVGRATAEMLCAAPRIEDRHVDLSMFSVQGGGAAANAVAAVAMLGGRARYFGRLADDMCGDFVRRGLSVLGVDVGLVSVERGRVSPVSIIEIEELTRRQRVLFTPGNTSPLAARDLPRRLLEGAGVLIVDGTLPALQVAAAERARDRGVTVVLNASTLSEGMGDLLGLSDVVVGSERFAGEIAPSDDLEESLREIARLGPRLPVITLGDAGAMALHGGRVIRREAIDVSPVDTTGAGDVFCGAFAFALAGRHPVDRALAIANAAAGLSCRSFGARSALPTFKEVQAALKD